VNPNPIHIDAHFAAQTEFGKPLVDSTFTLALVTGLSVSDVSQNGINLGWDDVQMPAPVFEGDTIYAQSELPVFGANRIMTFNQDIRPAVFSCSSWLPG
jgi:acyl dehydratase